MMPVIETKRLLIKAGTVEDYVIVHEYDYNYLMNIDGIFEYVKRDPNEVRSWFSDGLENHHKRAIDKHNYLFLVYLKDTNTPIGDITFDRNNEELKSTEISCYLHPNYWGQGYMIEDLIKCMEYLFNDGFENILYSYYEGNTKSKRLCEKLGFEPYQQVEEGNYLGNTSTVYKNIMSKEKYYQLYSNS